MKILKCSENTIILNGISLMGDFELHNPNDNLAVVFEFQFSQRIPILIQPQKGLVMQNETKKIKIRVKGKAREIALQQGFDGSLIHLIAAYKCQYNKKIMERLKMNNWNEIKSISEEIIFPIKISHEVWSLRSSIRQSSRSLLHDNSNSKVIKQSSQPKKIYTSQSSQKINKKLERELDHMFENATSQRIDSSNSQERMMKSKPKKARLIEEYEPMKMRTESPQQPREDSSQRNLQVILLALLAGFFVALGSNFAKLF